ncbi:amidohydrolase [Citricoccus zhacaiensis]|uniref:2-amino-3-carboxymuconate-6-semialdehyde decarboxylase n=1 Tax=Citricoccus zhacaiensis TaxID=489142 RepID=A0ABQ2M9Z0_9MICC|nr:amidohydrolase family protein [Citricoccus zhacaiensis]GGO48669.1 amidohydrolase [Citricoccus zhacaiensis]
MTAPGTIDVHAHFLPEGDPPAAVTESFRDVPRVVRDSSTSGRVVRGDVDFRTVRSSLWNLSDRLAEMDAAGIGVQVISPMPVALDYQAPPKAFAAYCRWVNDAIAAAVRDSQGRLCGLGTLPLADPERLVQELDYLHFDLGLSGVEIGTRIAGMDLDDARLHGFFAAAQRLGMAILVHPVDGGGGAIRRGGFVYNFGLGMPSDTALAASALVFGGVLERFPALRIAMVHGCGTFTWAYPRLRMGAKIARTHDLEQLDRNLARLYVDTLVFDPDDLRLLVQRFGTERLLVGSDHPFVPGQPDGSLKDLAEMAPNLESEAMSRILRTNALEFLGLPVTPGAQDPGSPSTHEPATASIKG